MFSLSRALLTSITWGAVGAVLGSLARYAVDNFSQLRECTALSYRWLVEFQFLWEHWVTKEWGNLVPLLEEKKNDAESPSVFAGPTISCQVCHGLSYDTPHREATPGKWEMHVGRGFDMFIEDLSCTYPRTCDWVGSAICGCTSCQIVINAVSAYSPEIFKNYTPESDDLDLGSTHIRAIANRIKPLGVVICRPWIPWQSEREEYLEVFTEVGIVHLHHISSGR